MQRWTTVGATVLAASAMMAGAAPAAHAYYFVYGDIGNPPGTSQGDTLAAPGVSDSSQSVVGRLTTPTLLQESFASRSAVSITGTRGSEDTNRTYRSLQLHQSFSIAASPGEISLLVPVTVRYSLLGQGLVSNPESYGYWWFTTYILDPGFVGMGSGSAEHIYGGPAQEIVQRANALAFTTTLSVGVSYDLVVNFGTSAKATWAGAAAQSIADFSNLVPGQGPGGFVLTMQIPEPGSAPLMLGALAMLGWYLRPRAAPAVVLRG